MSEEPTPKAVICDFGGVLTTPLLDAFLAYQDATGISPQHFGNALAAGREETGAHPLYELECGRITEEEFLRDLGRRLEPELGHRPELHGFREMYFDALAPNEPLIALMAEAQAAGFRMAMLTNNVREWEPLWRAKLPVDDIFEFVVDSAFVGMRKPDPAIYELTVSGFGDGITAGDCLFVDDNWENCEAGKRAGLRVVQYIDPEQAVAALRSALELPAAG